MEDVTHTQKQSVVTSVQPRSNFDNYQHAGSFSSNYCIVSFLPILSWSVSQRFIYLVNIFKESKFGFVDLLCICFLFHDLCIILFYALWAYLVVLSLTSQTKSLTH